MKKLIIVLFVFLFSSSILHAAKFNWIKISTTNDDISIFYLDKKTTFKIGKYIYYWMLTNYYDDDENKSNVTHNMVKCSTLENRIITFTSFNKHNGRGNVIFDFIVPEDMPDMFEWNKYSKKSTHGAVLVEVCKIR